MDPGTTRCPQGWMNAQAKAGGRVDARSQFLAETGSRLVVGGSP